MAAELRLTVEAGQDLDEAYAYYEAQRPGLGEDFFGAAEACFQRILRHPFAHEAIARDYRRALLRRFPYAVSTA